MEGDSLRGALESAFKSAEEQVDPALLEPSPEPVTEPVTEPSSPVKEPDGRARDESGKFAKVEKADIKPDAPVDAPVTQEQEPAKLAPPEGWNGGAKVRWDKLPRQVQEAIAQDYQKLSTIQSNYGSLEKIIEPRKQALAAAYGSPENAINQLFALSDYAAKDASGFIQWFAQQRGINLQSLAPQSQTEEQQHPLVQQLYEKINGLEQQLQTLSTRTESSSQQPYIAQIEAFSRDPKHAYFNDVREDMVLLLDSKRAKNLDEAYDMATRMNPSVWTQLQADQRERDNEERQRKAAQARAAAASISGAPTPGVSDAPVAGTVREELERQFRLRA